MSDEVINFVEINQFNTKHLTGILLFKTRRFWHTQISPFVLGHLFGTNPQKVYPQCGYIRQGKISNKVDYAILLL